MGPPPVSADTTLGELRLKSLRNFIRIARSFPVPAGLLLLLSAAASPSFAATPLCDAKDALGSEVTSWPALSRSNSSDLRQKAEAFERRWREHLHKQSTTHRTAAGQVPGINSSLDARTAFFALSFSRSGDIVELCAEKKFAQEKFTTFLKAQEFARNSDQGNQCGALRDARMTYDEASKVYDGLLEKLNDRFDPTPNETDGMPKGRRLQDFFRGRRTNQTNLQQNGTALASQATALQREVLALWGRGTSPTKANPLPLDTSGYYSRFALEALAEREQDMEAVRKLRENGAKLAKSAESCPSDEFTQEAGDTPERDGKDRPRPGRSTKDTRSTVSTDTRTDDDSSFLGRNWMWIAGGTAVVGGGGYYIYHENQKVKEQNEEWRWAQFDHNAKLNEEAKRLATATSVVTSTVTSTGTATSTDNSISVATVTGKELEPMEIEILDVPSINVQNLPRGASYSSTDRLIRWLPQKGQSGKKEVTIQAGTLTRKITLDVKSTELAKGPPDNYRDGDIGYVFIHGAGDSDRCKDSFTLEEYWGAGPAVISPQPSYRTVACYDAREAVISEAPKVADQILKAPCGRFGRCILITHSMGGLLAEHMFTHTRAAKDSDLEPGMFEHFEKYKKVRDRTLFVISLASAAGGSKVANILQRAGDYDFKQKAVASIQRWSGGNTNAYRNLRSEYASTVVAPKDVDPGVPFFMVGGYSVKTLREEERGFGRLGALLLETLSPKIFNSDSSCAALDYVAEFGSRSDGLVDLRSACGIADGNEDAGPGKNGTVDEGLLYCSTAAKKPNHVAWFLMNLNHFEMALPSVRCDFEGNKCVTLFQKGSTFTEDPTFAGKNVMQVLRTLLTRNKSGNYPIRQALDLNF